MLYQLVAPTYLTNERIDYCRIYCYAEISVECWSNKLVQYVGPTCWYKIKQHVGPTFHGKFAPLRKAEISVKCWSEKLARQVGTT